MDGQASVLVRYQGLLPDLFREGQGVVAEGVLEPSGTFRADTVLAKHDETSYEDGCVKPVLFSAGRHRPFSRVLAFLGAEVELRAARVPSPTSYPAGRCPRHDPLFGSEELRGERRHSTSAALSGSPR